MSVYDPALPHARPVAYALVPGEDEVLFIAENPEVLTRTVVLNLVARLRPDEIPPGQVGPLRSALEAGDWQDAIVAWMDITGRRLNMFPDEAVWSEGDLDDERVRLELPLTPIFSEPTTEGQ